MAGIAWPAQRAGPWAVGPCETIAGSGSARISTVSSLVHFGAWRWRAPPSCRRRPSRCAPPPAHDSPPIGTELPTTLPERSPRPSLAARARAAARRRLAVASPLAHAVTGRWRTGIARSNPRACALSTGGAARENRSIGAVGSSVACRAASGAVGLARCARIDLVDFGHLCVLRVHVGACGVRGARAIDTLGRTLGS